MKIIVYFGHHKVGSTALQAFFARNYTNLLRKGILYPGVESEALSAALAGATGRDISSAGSSLNVREPHNALAFKMLAAAKGGAPPVWHPNLPSVHQMFEALRMQARYLEPHTVILCSEVMANFGGQDPDLIDAIRDIFPGAEYQLYCVLRRPDEYLVSWHAQRLKFGHKVSKLSDGGALSYANKIHFDYHMFISPWMQKFGAESLHVRNYSDVLASGGSVEDFMQQVNVEFPSDLEPVGRLNTSLPRAAMEIVRQGNINLQKKDSRALVDFFLTSDLMAPKNREIEMFGASTRRELSRRFEPIHNFLSELVSNELFFPDISKMTELRPIPEPQAMEELLRHISPDALPNDTLKRYIDAIKARGISECGKSQLAEIQREKPEPPTVPSSSERFEFKPMLTLQSLCPPERSICSEQQLYFRESGAVGFSERTKEYTLSPGAFLGFNTYFNLFNLSKWSQACELNELYAEVTGQGLMEVRLIHAIPHQSWEVIYREVVTLTFGDPLIVDISDRLRICGKGAIYLEIRSLSSEVVVSGGRFATQSVPVKLPKLAISITTFKRENQVRETVQRLTAFLDEFEFGDNIRVQVVDNGRSAEIENSSRVVPIDNPNYGGSGGFARGLLEAERAKFTHCLFMDDDAAFHLENIVRTYMFLALAKSARTAVAGAMISNTHKWAMWENGAFFDGACHPLYAGTDLRDFNAVINMEFESATNQPPTLYGGWWFFAFTIGAVKHHPFPFFVRGDDVSFSLMNDLSIVLLNGVVSFQDDFTEKESPLTVYLDLRSHLVHHLLSDDLERSRLGTAKIAIRFIMHSLLRFHYKTARIQLMAWLDVMEGPSFFDKNIDMAERRATIQEMAQSENWQVINSAELSERRRFTLKSPHIRRQMGIRWLNGHLSPFSGRRWDRIVLGIDDRVRLAPSFGASQITYLNTTRDKGYVVAQSKREFFVICVRMTLALLRFLWLHDSLKAAYRRGYSNMATRSYWREKIFKKESYDERRSES